MFVLELNDMRAVKIEILMTVRRSESKQALVDFVTNESVENYMDGRWSKSFRKDGPLEWYNPPSHEGNFVNVGTEDSWREDAAIIYREAVLSVPELK